jgi:hypothetical protein
MRRRGRLTIRLLPGDPHTLLLEEVASFRQDALDRLGLTLAGGDQRDRA